MPLASYVCIKLDGDSVGSTKYRKCFGGRMEGIMWRTKAYNGNMWRMGNIYGKHIEVWIYS